MKQKNLIFIFEGFVYYLKMKSPTLNESIFSLSHTQYEAKTINDAAIFPTDRAIFRIFVDSLELNQEGCKGV